MINHIFSKLPGEERYHLISILKPSREDLRIGRNDQCPCGSGKKYKKCCLLLKGAEMERRWIDSIIDSNGYLSSDFQVPVIPDREENETRKKIVHTLQGDQTVGWVLNKSPEIVEKEHVDKMTPAQLAVLAEAYLNNENYDAMILMFKRILEKSPDEFLDYHKIGETVSNHYKRKGEIASAVPFMEQLTGFIEAGGIALQEDKDFILRSYYELLGETDRKEEAVEKLREMIKNNPEEFLNHYSLIPILKSEENYVEAMELAEKGLELTSGDEELKGFMTFFAREIRACDAVIKESEVKVIDSGDDATMTQNTEEISAS